jgi:hypothetical protein
MIYKKEEFVQQDDADSEFPIKQVDRLEAIDGGSSRFIGRVALNMMSARTVQQLPISFEIEAETIEDAFAKFAEAAREKIEEVRARVEEMRREEANRIVTPDQAAGGGIIRLDNFQGDS